jgi:hypothetical protein
VRLVRCRLAKMMYTFRAWPRHWESPGNLARRSRLTVHGCNVGLQVCSFMRRALLDESQPNICCKNPFPRAGSVSASASASASERSICRTDSLIASSRVAS